MLLFRLDGQRSISLFMVAQERPSDDRSAKKISEHKNYQAHKEAINILEIAKKFTLVSLFFSILYVFFDLCLTVTYNV